MIKIIIKLVEDNLGDVLAVQELLQDNDLYDLECFTEGPPFISKLSKDIDLVITDIRMDNYDAMQTIRDIHKDFPGIRIIVISALFTEKIYHDLFWYRVDGVIKKDGAYWPNKLMDWILRLTPDIIERKKLLTL